MDGGDEAEYLDADQQQAEVGGGGHCARSILVHSGGGHHSPLRGRSGQPGNSQGARRDWQDPWDRRHSAALALPYATAAQKVRAAEDGWNSRDPQRVSLAYSPDSVWRNRSTFVRGRERIVEFLSGKWQREQEYRLIKELWAFTGNRIAVRFAYEWHDDSGNWFRSYGNENWAFDEQGLMYERHASINDLPIREDQRLFRWPLGRRPDDHPSLGELGL